MQLPGITYHSPEKTDWKTFECLPEYLKVFSTEYGGTIAFEGGLQIHGCLREPPWISLYEIWKGKFCLYKRYKSVLETDIPIAQDCCGNQFLVRNGLVFRLYSETGMIESLGFAPFEFIETTVKNENDFLSLAPLRKLQKQGKNLSPGELLNIYPPFTISTSGDYSVKAVSAGEQLNLLAHFYSEIKDLPEGAQVEIKLT